jgi:hypothetical protein
MGTAQWTIAGAGLSFLFIFLTGIQLRRSGRPHSALIFNIHKLIGLAAGVLLIITVYRMHQVAALGPFEIAAVVVTALLLATTAAVGGLLSIDRPMPAAISIMNRLLPYLAVLSTAVTLYLLLSRRQ